MKERKPSFVMYESALEIARQLPNEYGYKFLLSVCEYGFYGIEPDFSSCEPYSLAMSLGFTPLRAAIDTSKKRYENCVKNGSGGGPPKGNQNARKYPKDSQETTKKTTKKQPKNNQKNNLTYTETDTDTVTDSISLPLSVSEKTDNYGNNNPPKAGGGYPAPAQAVNKPLEELTKEERAALLPTLI